MLKIGWVKISSSLIKFLSESKVSRSFSILSILIFLFEELKKEIKLSISSKVVVSSIVRENLVLSINLKLIPSLTDLSNHNSALLSSIRYPGLKQDPNHNIAKSQMRGFGGIISAELNTDLKGTLKFLENIEIFTLAESLGGVESLIEHPAIMTHASIEKNIREELGISDSLVRLSVGIEDVKDLVSALDKALNLI